MSIKVPRSADVVLCGSSGDNTSTQARKYSVSRYVLGTRGRRRSVETNSARSQLCLPYKGRGVAAIIPIRQISTHVSRSQNPLGSLRVSTLYERFCRSNSLSKRHVVIRPSQPFNLFQGNRGQFVACNTGTGRRCWDRISVYFQRFAESGSPNYPFRRVTPMHECEK